MSVEGLESPDGAEQIRVKDERTRRTVFEEEAEAYVNGIQFCCECRQRGREPSQESERITP